MFAEPLDRFLCAYYHLREQAWRTDRPPRPCRRFLTQGSLKSDGRTTLSWAPEIASHAKVIQEKFPFQELLCLHRNWLACGSCVIRQESQDQAGTSNAIVFPHSVSSRQAIPAHPLNIHLDVIGICQPRPCGSIPLSQELPSWAASQMFQQISRFGFRSHSTTKVDVCLPSVLRRSDLPLLNGVFH